jgi:hypothetical protein
MKGNQENHLPTSQASAKASAMTESTLMLLLTLK